AWLLPGECYWLLRTSLLLAAIFFGADFGQVVRRKLVSWLQPHRFFKLRNCLVEAAFDCQSHAQIQVGHGEVRIDADDFLELLSGLGGLAAEGQFFSQSIMRLPVVSGAQFDGLLIIDNGFSAAIHPREGLALDEIKVVIL